MTQSLQNILKSIPENDQYNYRLDNNILFTKLNKTCIVIDDDPTGNQTVYDIPLLTSWSIDVFVQEFLEKTPVFFILTNSRSLSVEETEKIYKEIAQNILIAANVTKHSFTIVSRSDSTLRGHFPLEPKTLKTNLKFDDAITVFIPVMFEGQRVTVNNMHYILDDDVLTPVNETPFAKDHSFKYLNADLKLYIEEKTKGSVQALNVFSFSLNQIRYLDIAVLAENILEIPSNSYCVFDSLNYADLDKVTQALLRAETLGKQIIYRTSSSFIPSYIGLKFKNLLTRKEILVEDNNNGGLTIVGSYVKKSSDQLSHALVLFNTDTSIEIDISKILSEIKNDYLNSIITQIDKHIVEGLDVIIYTGRKLVTGKDTKETLDIASKVSNALVQLVKGITKRPRYIIAKGGITSHDIALKGLGMIRSKVLGQVQSGVPLWKMDNHTRFPRLPFIVFPGNVGDSKSLNTIITKLKHHD